MCKVSFIVTAYNLEQFLIEKLKKLFRSFNCNYYIGCSLIRLKRLTSKR